MIPRHHVKTEVCTTRPAYRDGRKLTSVKVYTVHQESKYLLVQNVPAVGAKDQLAKLLSAYGDIEDLHPLDEYPADKFTEVYLAKFNKIQSARFAKKKLDDYSFFGGSLHICYAPEYETVKETRQKLQDRRRVIAAKIRKLEKESESGISAQTTAKSAAASSSSMLSLSSQPTPALHPPPSSFQPPLPPGPPPPLTASDSSPTSSSSSLTSGFHPVSGSQAPVQVRALPPFQTGEMAPPGCGPNHVHLHGQGGDVTSAASDLTFSDMTFQIPPPPMPGVSFDATQYRTPHFTRKDYGFAWVPSANSSFPPGYDPRLPQGGGEGEDGKTDTSIQGNDGFHVSPSSIESVAVDDRLQLVKSVSHISSHKSVKTLPLSKPNDFTAEPSVKAPVSGSGKVIVKQYKPKGPPPRFVPRQIKDRKEEIRSGGERVPSKLSAVKEKDEEVNREIRREAFRLGKDQGPSLPSDPDTREQLLGQRPLVDPKVEASVTMSVKAIRKRMSKFISETVPKQLKKSAEMTSAKTSGDSSSVD